MTINITGIDTALASITPARLTTGLRAITFAVATEASSRIRPYPPQRALRRPYRRTGQLGQGWRVEHQGALDARVTNRVSYATYVQGEDQVQFHADAGWKNSDGIAEQVQNDGSVDRIAEQVLSQMFTG